MLLYVYLFICVFFLLYICRRTASGCCWPTSVRRSHVFSFFSRYSALLVQKYKYRHLSSPIAQFSCFVCTKVQIHAWALLYWYKRTKNGHLERETRERLILFVQKYKYRPELFFTGTNVLKRTPGARDARASNSSPSTKFSCFPGTNVQILTPAWQV